MAVTGAEGGGQLHFSIAGCWAKVNTVAISTRAIDLLNRCKFFIREPPELFMSIQSMAQKTFTFCFLSRQPKAQDLLA